MVTSPLPVIAPMPDTLPAWLFAIQAPPWTFIRPAPRSTIAPSALSSDADRRSSVLVSPAVDWPACMWPPRLDIAPPAVSDSDAVERSRPCVLFTSPPIVAFTPCCAARIPFALFQLPALTTACPFVTMVPDALFSAFAPLPGAIVSVPVPACVIVPPALFSAPGLSVRSVLLVWITPADELSSVPLTSTAIADVPYWVIEPLWFVRFAAVNASWFASSLPWLLSSRLLASTTRFGATIDPCLFVIVAA
ncbi:hypothetical protein FEP58_04146 [Burkholderia multivorans]|nr:hypothetical protein [Burkholderia multivorans]